jgi:hypothetical protein
MFFNVILVPEDDVVSLHHTFFKLGATLGALLDFVFIHAYSFFSQSNIMMLHLQHRKAGKLEFVNAGYFPRRSPSPM